MKSTRMNALPSSTDRRKGTVQPNLEQVAVPPVVAEYVFVRKDRDKRIGFNLCLLLLVEFRPKNTPKKHNTHHRHPGGCSEGLDAFRFFFQQVV